MKSPEKNLRSELVRKAWGTSGIKIINLILKFTISLILARKLQPEGYGTYIYVVSLVMLISLPVNAGIPSLIIREVAKYQVGGHWGLLKGLLRRSHQVVALISLVAVVVLIILCLPRASLDLTEQWTLLLLATPLVPLLAMRNLRSAVLQGFRKIVQGLLPEMVIQPVVFLVLIVFLLKVGDLTPALTIIAQVTAAFTSFAVGTWMLLKMLPGEVRSASPEFDNKRWLQALLPFTLLAGVTLLNSQITIVILGLFSNVSNVGLYRVATQGAMLVSLSLVIVNTVISPYITRLYQAGDMRKLQLLATQSSRVVLLGALPFSLLFFLAGDRVLALLFGGEYQAAYSALVILTVGQLANAAMGSVGMLLTMTGHERKTFNGLFAALIMNVFLSVVLVPFWGTTGAAIASAASVVTWNVCLYRQVSVQLGVKSAAWAHVGKLRTRE